MRPPPFSAGQPQSDRVDRWLIKFLTLVAVLFALSNFIRYAYSADIAFQGTSVFFISICAIKAMLVPAARAPYRGRGTVLLTLLFATAIFNMVISMDIIETSLRWVMWFVMVVSLNRIIGATSGTWVPELIKRLPRLFLIIYSSLMLSAHFLQSENVVLVAHHLSGLYGNLMFASGLFAEKFWQRMGWSVFGLFAIYFSGAGGALFTVPIMFVPYILYSANSTPVKGIGVAMLLLMGGAFFFQSQLFGRFLDIKLNISYSDTSVNGIERLERSRDMRLQLINYGLQKVVERPEGTGLGHTYAEELSRIYMVSHVHNGTITMLVELGIPGFAVIAGLLGWIMWTILRSTVIENQLKGFYFTYFFTIFGRSLSENYTPFDLGNFFNFVYLIFTLGLFLHHQTRLDAKSGGRPAPMMPWRQPPPHLGMPRPMPRPVGFR